MMKVFYRIECDRVAHADPEFTTKRDGLKALRGKAGECESAFATHRLVRIEVIETRHPDEEEHSAIRRLGEE